MIHPDGKISFDSPAIIIGPHTKRDDFIASPLFTISKPLNQNAPWSRYGFRPVTANGEQFAGDICFYLGAIYTVSLDSIRPEFGRSWNDYSTEQERARHCFHKCLLEADFKRSPDNLVPWGPDERDADAGYNFPWGSVSADTDFKSGTCGILIKYKT